jgi:HK97 family phage prohead protease
VTQAKVTNAGIEVTAKIAKSDGALKQFLDSAWESIKLGLVRGFSIGFVPIESADIEGTWGRRFTKWEWYELSAVTIPANAEATIQTIKSIDSAIRRGRPIPLIKSRESSLSRGAVALVRR